MNAKAIQQAAAALRHDWLDQPALSMMQILIFATGALFWVEATTRADAFDVTIYGRLALMAPAEAWAGVMMAATAIVWIGLRNPPKRWMVAVGASIQTLQFIALAYSALATGGEPIVGMWASVFFAPIYARLTWEALRHA